MSAIDVRRQSSCEGKERFASPLLAKRVAQRRRGVGKTNRKRQADPCKYCGGWPVGSPIKVRRLAR